MQAYQDCDNDHDDYDDEDDGLIKMSANSSENESEVESVTGHGGDSGALQA